MSSPPRTSLVALSAWYGACAGSVALGPWLVVLLTDTGWSDAAASALLLALPVGRLISGPVWAWLADKTRPDRVLVASLVASVVGCVWMLVATSPIPVFLAIVLWAVARAPAFPLVDATTVTLVGRRYGRIRAVGSVTFLVVVAANGFLREAWAPGPVLIAAVLSVLTLVLAFWLPPLVVAPAPPTLRSLRSLAGHPLLVPLAVVCVLHGAAMSTYDQMFALHVEALGLPSTVTGAGLATGVGAEVVVLVMSDRLLRWFGPMPLFVAAVASGVPRFWLTSEAASALPLVTIQALHGLQFGAFWIAGTAMFAEQAPHDLRHSTQALLPAAAFGAGPLFGLLAGSIILAWSDTATVYAAMAGVSLLGTVLALLLAARRGAAGV